MYNFKEINRLCYIYKINKALLDLGNDISTNKSIKFDPENPITSLQKIIIYQNNCLTDMNNIQNNHNKSFKKKYNSINQYVSGGSIKLKYESAGVIPYYRSTDKLYFLFGYDTEKNLWSYFGGGRESYEKNPYETMLREAFEESYDIMNKVEHLPVQQNFLPALLQNEYIIVPKLHEKTGNWNNIFFIKLNMNVWMINHDNKNNYVFDGKTSYVQNDEVAQMKWFSIKQIYDDLIPKNMLFKPFMEIFNDHKDEIYKMI